MHDRCTYSGWWFDEPDEPVRMAPTGRTDRSCTMRITEFRCTEPVLANGRCSVHLDAGDGPGA